MIATRNGELPIEDLNIGDTLITANGRETFVKWVGRQTVVKVFSGPRAAMVRISAGTLGTHTDLIVTGDHGMIVDGCVINASALVNGHSITWVPFAELPERFTIYHVETEAHDVILANGAASETYLDVPGRQAFDNYQEYLDLYGDERAIAENPLPRISSRRLLPQKIQKMLGAGVAA